MDKSRILAGIFVTRLLPDPDKNSHLNGCHGSVIFSSRALITGGLKMVLP